MSLRWFVGALVLLALVPAGSEARGPRARLAAFESCPDLVAFGRQAARRTGTDGGVPVRALGGSVQTFGLPAPSAKTLNGAVTPEAAVPTAGAIDDSSSTTNVQEAGVDEPDIVKSDGKRAYLLSNGALLVYDITVDMPKLLGSLTLDGGATELLIRGPRALVIGSGANAAYDTGVVGPQTALLGPISYRPQVRLTEVDISDPAALKISRTLDVAGSYVSARLTGGTARVVLNTPPQLVPEPLASGSPGTGTTGSSGSGSATGVAAPDTSSARAGATTKLGVRSFLPETVLKSDISHRTFRRPLVGCTQVRHALPFSGLDLLTVLTIDLDHGLFNVDRDAVMAGAQVVYASTGSLYVASQRFVRGGIDTVAEVPDGIKTEIHRFDTSDPGQTRYRSTGEVPGFVLNQFAMSEYKDDLRVATTQDPPWIPNNGQQQGQSSSSVTVLREHGTRLDQVGQVNGLGTGERIYAVRFIGDAGFVVTFRQVDPLYTLDLSKPESPAVLGELKIAGYSAYLHPIGDNLLLGVGQDANDAGRTTGTKVSVFDVADLRAPKRLSERALSAGGGASSEAEFDHHAFLWWAPTSMAMLPLQQYSGAPDGKGSFAGAVGLRVTRADGIKEIARITHGTAQYPPVVRRALVAGSRVVTISDLGIAAARLDTLAPLGFTALPQPDPGPVPAPVPGPKPVPLPLSATR